MRYEKGKTIDIVNKLIGNCLTVIIIYRDIIKALLTLF